MGILDLIFSKSFASRVGELREKVVQLNNSRRETLFKSQEYTQVKSEFKDSINDLHIGASYNVFKGVSVYAQVHNLLNKKYQYYLGYPAEGFNFLGGLSFRF